MMYRLLSSIGIIGGADGPTAIFVTSSPDWWKDAIIAAVAVAVVAGIIIMRKKRKK